MNLTRTGQNSGDSLRVCLAQSGSAWEDPATSLKKAEILIRHAAASGAGFVCFPEQFATGWDPQSRNNIETREGRIVSALIRFARENRIGILGSFREEGDPLPRNTAIAISSQGAILAEYSKIHLFSPGGENRGFSPGSSLGIFRQGSLTCGIAICYDLRFADLFSIYADKGVQAVFVPAAWPKSRLRHWELFISARAAENQMYVIGVNTTGETPVDTYAGSSIVADPQGTIISRANEAEQLLFVDIDPVAVDAARRNFPVRGDRNVSLYRHLSR